MRLYVAAAVAFLALLCILTAGMLQPMDTVPPSLAGHLANGPAPFFVLLDDGADQTAFMNIPDATVRRARMVKEQMQTAGRTQAPLLAELAARGVPARSFWIVNAVLVEGDVGLARELASRPDVAGLVPDVQHRVDLPRPETSALAPQRVDAVEWNVERVGAPTIWENEGVRGEGVVIAIADTGIEWQHPVLIDHERVVDDAVHQIYFPLWIFRSSSLVTATQSIPTTSVAQRHDYAWHDAIEPTSAPHDDHGHGTHVTGTSVGDDGTGEQIGVAPGAEWIGCRNMDHGVGRLSTYLDCFEWFLAPTQIDGSKPRPDLAPHIVSNSWTCPPPNAEDCTDDVLDVMRQSVQTLREAGIVVVAAAGNSGPSCSTVKDPPAIYDETFTVGASTSSDTLAGFSSRGPVTRDGSNRPKPDLVAPGDGVRSSWPPAGYATLRGTSMATPAVSGVTALLWSAVPHLQGKVDLTERILRESAEPVTDTSCGGDDDGHPNNAWGWGMVDAAAAVELAKTCPTTGDWDADGTISPADVEFMVERVGETVRPETSPYDLDGNGTIDQRDVSIIESQAGLSCQWPDEQ